jgi:hypothetical protein
MFEKDNEIIYQALIMWANHIETGNVNLSAKDAQDIPNVDFCGNKKKSIIKALDLNQMKLVIRIRELAIKHLED